VVSVQVAHPERRAAPRALARSVVELVHGSGEAERAARASAALFGEELGALDERTLLDVFDDAPSSDASRQELVDGLLLVEALVVTGLASSRGEARRTISQGGAYVNNLREGDEARVLGTGDLLHDRYVVLRRGRRDYHLLRIG